MIAALDGAQVGSLKLVQIDFDGAKISESAHGHEVESHGGVGTLMTTTTDMKQETNPQRTSLDARISKYAHETHELLPGSLNRSFR